MHARDKYNNHQMEKMSLHILVYFPCPNKKPPLKFYFNLEMKEKSLFFLFTISGSMTEF